MLSEASLYSYLPGDSLKQRLIWSPASTKWGILLAEPHKNKGELITKITTKHLGRLKHLWEWNTRLSAVSRLAGIRALATAGFQAINSISKRSFTLAFPKAEQRSRMAPFQEAPWLHTLIPAKNCTVLFSSKPIYGALRQEPELPHQGLCFFWNWSKQLCASTFQWVDTYWNTQQIFPIQTAVGSPSFKG